MSTRNVSSTGWRCGLVSAVFAMMGTMGMTGMIGCGELPDASEEEETVSSAINPPEGWRVWTTPPNNPGTTATFSDSPAVCLATTEGVAIIGRSSTSNRYRSLTNQWRAYTSPAWADVGTLTFNSKPACTALDQVSMSPPTPNKQIAVVGKRDTPGATSTHNKYYVRTMLVDTTQGEFASPVSQPTVKVNWTKLSDNVYASGPGTTVAMGQLMVVGRRSNNRIYMYRNTLSSSTTDPYNSGNWQSPLQLPTLPSGWTAAGDPVIANTVPMIGVVTIMTRATSFGTNRLYYIYWDGTVFWDGVAINSWSQVPTGTTVVSSDPSLEVDVGGTTHANLATIFIRGATNNGGTITNSNRIFQASGIGNLWENFTIVRSQDADTFTGTPAAVGSGNFEGWHWVVAKKTNNQFYYSTPVPF
jgi:hypothetical protein